MRDVIEEHLLATGFHVVTASDTIIARQKFELNSDVHLCLVDLVMPSGVPDGVEFAQYVKGENRNMPVILMTGYYTAAERAKRTANSLLFKPVDLNTLVAEIERHLVSSC